MYQKYDWVIFHQPYRMLLTPTVGYIFNKGEKGEIIDVVEENGIITYWIKLPHRDGMIVALTDRIINKYMEDITY